MALARRPLLFAYRKAAAPADHGDRSHLPLSPCIDLPALDSCQIHSNVLVITIQPDEGFDLCFDVKVPGPGLTLQRQSLHFRYGEVFPKIPEAYETLLLDILTGDQTLFVRSDMVEASWRLYAPLSGEAPGVASLREWALGTGGCGAEPALEGREPMVLAVKPASAFIRT